MDLTQNAGKLAVVSCAIPPHVSGQALILDRLLVDWDPEKYCLITSTPKEQENLNLENSRVSCYFIGKQKKANLKNSLLSKLHKQLQSFIHFPDKVLTLLNIIKKDHVTAVLACSGDLTDLPACYLACFFSNTPFYIYMFDDYAFQWPWRIIHPFVNFLCKFLIKKANQVIVPNEYLAMDYKKRYHINSIVIHNPVAIKDNKTSKLSRAPSQTIKIVYTGSIYHAHFDAFQNLANVINEHFSNIELHIYTPQEKQVLDENHIRGPRIYCHSQLPLDQIKAVQENADILFLPLAFNSTISAVIRTSAPGKIGEYLTSGVPILVHAPKDSFISYVFKEKQCGIVVDEDDPLKLKEAITHILNHPDARNEFVNNAFSWAQKDFALENSRKLFNEIFQKFIKG